MPLRWQEAAVPLVVIVSLIVLKYVPATAGLPLARAAGIVAFFYAAFLALRLVQREEGVPVDGWEEVRPSLVQYFACYGMGALAGALLLAVIALGGARHVDTTQLVASFALSLLLAALALWIGLRSLAPRLRWNSTGIEHRNAFGQFTRLGWAEVRSVAPGWAGITIGAENGASIRFSALAGGAPNLLRHAENRVRRNGETATRAFASP